MYEDLGSVKRKGQARPAQAGAARSTRDVKTREMRYFESKGVLDRLDPNSKRIIAAGNASYYDADFYIRSQITGTQDVLLTSNQKVVGVSNLNENRLPELTNLIISAVRVAYATHATLTNPAAVKYDNVNAAVPVALLNGELIIKINDRPVVELPISKFFNANGTAPVSFQAQGSNDTIELQAMKVVTPQDVIGVEIKLPNGLTLGANNHFLEVRLLGASMKRAV